MSERGGGGGCFTLLLITLIYTQSTDVITSSLVLTV